MYIYIYMCVSWHMPEGASLEVNHAEFETSLDPRLIIAWADNLIIFKSKFPIYWPYIVLPIYTCLTRTFEVRREEILKFLER